MRLTEEEIREQMLAAGRDMGAKSDSPGPLMEVFGPVFARRIESAVLRKIGALGGPVECVTNDDRCDECDHTPPDHWAGCRHEPSYWRAVLLAERLRAAADGKD